MIGRSVLVVGAGVAGPALAFWLLHYGFAPTLVERSRAARTEGYIIDFWGLGYEIVERMGLLPQVLDAGYQVREVRLVGQNGNRVGGFDARLFGKVTGGRYTSLPRGALSDILLRAVADRVQMRWEDTPVDFEQRASGVWVRFQSGAEQLFDVVIGADGLHSTVRELVFGGSARFERPLGLSVAAFETAGYRPRDEGVYIGFAQPGRQVARFALRGDRTLFLLVAAEDSDRKAIAQRGSVRDYLHLQFAGMGWEASRILEAMEDATHVYSDRVSQIRMPRWSRGAIALLGDAAYAPSLLAGQGSALAIIGAYVLAGELSRAVTAEGAFDRYESTLREFIDAKQAAAVELAGSFVPRSHWALLVRNMATLAFAIPGIARWAIGCSLRDDLRLPEYPPPTPIDDDRTGRSGVLTARAPANTL